MSVGDPLGWQPGIDWEVYGTGPFEAVAYDEDICVAVIKSRRKSLLMVRMALKQRQLTR